MIKRFYNKTWTVKNIGDKKNITLHTTKTKVWSEKPLLSSGYIWENLFNKKTKSITKRRKNTYTLRLKRMP